MSQRLSGLEALVRPSGGLEAPTIPTPSIWRRWSSTTHGGAGKRPLNRRGGVVSEPSPLAKNDPLLLGKNVPRLKQHFDRENVDGFASIQFLQA
jgi:hypothetical protein